MDLLTSFLFLIIACAIGITLSLFIGLKSYLKMAVVVLLIYIPIELYYTYQKTSASAGKPGIKSESIAVAPEFIKSVISNIASNLTIGDNTTSPNSIFNITNKLGSEKNGSAIATIGADGSIITPNATISTNDVEKIIQMASPTQQQLIQFQTGAIPDYHSRKPEESIRISKQKNLDDIKYEIFKHNTGVNGIDNGKGGKEFEMDKPPFDGLEPTELLSRLNYIYYATANPAKQINYHDYKSHADKYLEQDGTKLSNNDPKLQTYSAGFYPQLSANQIDARDCLNYGSGPNSCFQSAQLFYNVKRDFNILDKGVNLDNQNLIIHEDFQSSTENKKAIVEGFSMPMKLDPRERNNSVLFMNAPNGNLDLSLHETSNEHIKLNAPEMELCRNCKLAVCKDDYCELQNQLFM